MKKIILFLVSFFALTVLAGCASIKPQIKTELDLLFEKNFTALDTPSVSKIKEYASVKSYPHATFDQVWDAAIIMLIQQGVMARSSKDSGIIIAITQPPSAWFIDKSVTINVYVAWLGDFYTKKLYKLTNEDYMYMAQHGSFDKMPMMRRIKGKEQLLDKLSTQIYAGQKWKYIYKNK